MRFRYTFLYRSYGLALPPGVRTLALRAPPELGLTATLTLDVDPLVKELDKYFAMGNRLLGALVGAPTAASLDEELLRVQKQRAKYGGASFLVVTGCGDYSWEPSTKARELDGIVVDLDGPGRAPLRDVLTASLQKLMCTMFLATPDLGTLELVADAGVFVQDGGRAVYQYNPQMSAKLHVGHVLTEEVNARILEIGRTLATEGQLQRVASLIADAVAHDNDPLRAFLTGWSALEMFVNKVFPTYEEAFSTALRAGHPALGHQHYLRRVREVMGDRLRLSDKFAVIAAALTPQTEDGDSASFTRLKKLRDDLAHGVLPIGSPLPHTEPADLARRLLTAHLQASAGAHGA